MGIMTFITSLFNMGWSPGSEFFNSILLTIDGTIYQILSYTFKLFNMVCQMNFNVLEGLISPLIDRVKALIVIIILYKVGISLIGYLIEPEKASKDGQKIVTNILIAACLLVSYQTIFGIMNEISLLIVGTSGTYQFTYLNTIAEITEAEDTGVINRLIFGGNAENTDAGEFVAYKMLSTFVRDAGSGGTTQLDKILGGTPIDFQKLPDIAPYVKKTVEYTALISTAAGIYLIYAIGKSAIEVGIRMFKLLMLQLIAPIAIMSIIIDGTKGDKFKSFTSTYVKTYTDAFIRISSLLITTVLISQILSNAGAMFADTSWLITIVICIAGYKFAQEAPKFLGEALKLNTGDQKGGFGSFLGKIAAGGLGAAAGAATGMFSGAISGARNGTGFGGAVANAAAGMFSGAASGLKGNTIKDKVANIKKSAQGNTTRAQGIYNAGGVGNYVGGKLGSVFNKGSQDRTMARYDTQLEALKEFDEAQKEAIADTKLITGEGAAAVNILTADEQSHYSDGYGNVKLSTDKSNFQSKMREYHTDVQQALAWEEQVKNDPTASDADIMAAHQLVLEAYERSDEMSGGIYDRNKNNARSDQINRTRANLEASGANIRRDSGGNIDIKQTKANITESKRALANTQSYRNAHNVDSKK